MTEFAKKLERYFQTFHNGRVLYYERRSHQYDALDIEKVRFVTPVNLIRAFAAMFLAEPHATTRSYSSLAGKVGDEILAENHRLEPYYVAAYTLYKLEYVFRNQRLDPKYKPARFHILLAVRLLANSADLPRMNSNEIGKYCNKIMNILWDPVKSDELLTEAAEIVDKVAEGNFNRDNIRTQPFTIRLVTLCATIAKEKEKAAA